MESSFQLMIAYMFYYIKFTALSIKTICWAVGSELNNYSNSLTIHKTYDKM